MEQTGNRKTVVTLAVLLVVVLVVIGAVAFARSKSNEDTASKSQPTAASSNTTTPSADPGTQPAAASNQAYKDGTYSATGRYSTPEDTETITVSVTLKDGTITDTSATASMVSRESKEYAGQFLESYKPMVVGQKVDGISLSRVSGSSLTSQGFNSAIDQIKTQAKS